jgi:hypothetical protein
MSIINKNELIEYFQDCIYDAYEGLNVNTPESFNIMRTEAILSAIDDIRTEPLLVEFNYDFDEVFNDALNSISYTGYQLYLSY